MVFMETFHILEAFGCWAPFDSWDEHLKKMLELLLGFLTFLLGKTGLHDEQAVPSVTVLTAYGGVPLSMLLDLGNHFSVFFSARLLS